MRQTFALFRLIVIAVFSLYVQSTCAESIDQTIELRDAQGWLTKIQSAASKLSYSGTFVYQQGNQVRTSKITHAVDGKNELEKLEVLDGKLREYIRVNEDIICYIPETKTMLLEKRAAQDVFPAILGGNSSNIGEQYHVKKGGLGRVAGYDSQSIELTPKDNLRYGYRLWAEKSSGLLLRTQTLNDKNEMVEQISFTQIQIGGINRNQAKSSFSNTNAWHVENPSMKLVDASNWKIGGLPPGFKKIRELKRVVAEATKQNGLAATSANMPNASQREFSQIVFSDGLAAISVFIEPSSQSRTEGSLQQGAMNITGKRQGDFWITIVGEVPSTAIRNVANSIEFQLK